MNPSLRKTLLRWLLLPAGLALMAFLPLAYHLVHKPAMEALDRGLADASLALIPHLDVFDGEPRFVFPVAAEQVLRSDHADQIYYLVLGPGGRFVAGDVGLPHEAPGAEALDGDRVIFDSHFNGQAIRVVAIHRMVSGQAFIFVAAETTRKREQVSFDLIFALTLPLIFFAAATGLTIWFGVRHALLPVEDIRVALKAMGHLALQPLDTRSTPEEIRPLVVEFNAVLGRLEEASAAQQRFVANAAHQLRTPLAGIRTQLELLQRESGEAERLTRSGLCISAIERLAKLVSQMLVLIAAEPGGRSHAAASVLDVPELIRERSPEWVHLAEARALDLGFELLPAWVGGDALLLGEMIANLVVNALNYTPSPGEVTVRSRQEEGMTLIEVEDNGPGIPLDARDRIFERFFRLPSTASPGSGLGLAIVREIASRFGGDVVALSPPDGQGTLLRVSLPALQAAPFDPLRKPSCTPST